MAPALLSCTALLSVAGCDLTGGQTVTGDVVIAADLEKSGANAQIGTAYERALELKIEQLNRSGALGGRRIRLWTEDNRSDESSSQRNIARFADDPSVVAIITGSCSACAITAAKTINDKRVPTISLAPATEITIPVSERRYLFKLAPNAADSAAALGAELGRAGVHTVGLLRTDDTYGTDGLAAMTAELAKSGIELVEELAVRPTDTDITQPVGVLLAAEPEAIVVWTFAEQATLVATTAKHADFTGRLYFDAAAGGELFLPGAAAAATDGATMVFPQTMVIDDVIANTPAKAARKQWFRDYTARYGGYYGTASFGADAVQLIVNAIAKGGADRDTVRTVLETTQLDGLSGPIRITPDNHSGLMPQALAILVARGGRWRLAG